MTVTDRGVLQLTKRCKGLIPRLIPPKKNGHTAKMKTTGHIMTRFGSPTSTFWAKHGRANTCASVEPAGHGAGHTAAQRGEVHGGVLPCLAGGRLGPGWAHPAPRCAAEIILGRQRSPANGNPFFAGSCKFWGGRTQHGRF